jgi:hypothetical protein
MSSNEHGKKPADPVLREHHTYANAEKADDITVGDRVYLWHYQILREGEVIKVTPTRARVRFKILGGMHREAWRKKKRLRKVVIE